MTWSLASSALIRGLLLILLLLEYKTLKPPLTFGIVPWSFDKASILLKVADLERGDILVPEGGGFSTGVSSAVCGSPSKFGALRWIVLRNLLWLSPFVFVIVPVRRSTTIVMCCLALMEVASGSGIGECSSKPCSSDVSLDGRTWPARFRRRSARRILLFYESPASWFCLRKVVVFSDTPFPTCSGNADEGDALPLIGVRCLESLGWFQVSLFFSLTSNVYLDLELTKESENETGTYHLDGGGDLDVSRGIGLMFAETEEEEGSLQQELSWTKLVFA